MPFVFLLFGLVLLVIAVQGTQAEAFGLLKKEFSGNNNFLVFASAIMVLGALAYIRPISKIAFAFIGLVLLAMILKDQGGFIQQLNNAIRNPTPASATVSTGGGGVTAPVLGSGTVELPADMPTGAGGSVPGFGVLSGSGYLPTP